MTSTADLLRDRRHAEALPGSRRDRRIRFLWGALPVAVGMVLAVMAITPMFPRGEVSFLLDRNKVAITRERVQVDHASYRGTDDEGRAFTVNAGQAVQHSARVPVVAMHNLVADLQLKDGPAQVVAPEGQYDLRQDQMTVSGPVHFSAQDGYSLTTSSVAVDMKTRKAVGTGGVNGTLRAGTFSAERIAVDIAEHTVTLQGRARLTMRQEKRK